MGPSHLEKDLQGAMRNAHAPPKEEKERHHQLDEVVEERLKLVKPPWGLVQVIGKRVGNRLSLKEKQSMHQLRKTLPQLHLWVCFAHGVSLILPGGIYNHFPTANLLGWCRRPSIKHVSVEKIGR